MSLHRRLLVSIPLLALLCAAIGAGTWSAFSGTTASSGNQVTAGSVAIGDNDAGSALIPMSNARPGDFVTRCIKVTYSGSLAANVRLYAAVTGSLGPYIDLTVTRGTDSLPSFPSCAGFSPDSTNYIGSGNGVIYSGTLASFPTSASAANEPPGAAATWNTGDPHSYKFTATLQASAPAAAQGVSATADFTWEAQNQ